LTPLYVDTSAFLKLLWVEPETSRVEEILAAEDEAVVSDLARLELTVQIQNRRADGLLTRSGAERLRRQAEDLLALAPFVVRSTGALLVEAARRQVDVRDSRSHCRTLDRLHLAAMGELGLDRLLTNDDAQARAARARGAKVLMPRVG
jgi:predicted nucleic acid-binding protein